MSFIQNLFPFLVSIASLILIHEFGHYIAAKMMKIEVEEFGIGFPPRAMKLFKYKETSFTLNWIPLGGFIKPKGESDPNIPNGLASAHPLRRIFVLIAGPFANLLLGAMLFGYIFLQLGEPIEEIVQISGIAENSPALASGLQVNDQITHINGIELFSIDETITTIQKFGHAPIEITLIRSEVVETITVVPSIVEGYDVPTIGVYVTNPTKEITSWWVALKYGIKDVGNLIKSIFSFPSRLIGYKSMYQIYTVVSDNQYNTINFFASISISLAAINLLPIPALDGGRILFSLPELFFKKRISPTIENTLNFVSFLLLMSAMIYVNIQDFINPLEIP
jgi:regulator of sigma E protease